MLIILGCAAAPWLAPYHPEAANLGDALAGPSGAHWLGTDELGRDTLSRLLYGGRPALLDSLLVVGVTLVLGVPTGLLAGFLGGWADRLTMQVTDVGMALPAMVIVLVVLSVFQGKLTIALISLGILLVPPLVRIVRSAALAVRSELFVDAARVSGVPPARIVFRHVLPRLRGTILVQASLVAALALLFTTGLAYLGFGATPPSPSWGSMTAEASQTLQQSPWLLIASGGTIGLTVLCLGLLGDTIRDLTVASWTGEQSAVHIPAPRRAAKYTADQLAEPGALLSVRGLTITIQQNARAVPVVQDVSLDIRAGETVGLVGESGSGKTSVARSVLGLLRGGARIESGRIVFDGADVTGLAGAGRPAAARRADRVHRPGADGRAGPHLPDRPAAGPGSALPPADHRPRGPAAGARSAPAGPAAGPGTGGPVLPARAVRRHGPAGGGGPGAGRRPRLLIADEPTAALDVTVQAEIIALLRGLQQQTGLAILVVSHDWGVVADLCDRARGDVRRPGRRRGPGRRADRPT